MKLKVLLLISFLMIFSCYAASAQQQEEQADKQICQDQQYIAKGKKGHKTILVKAKDYHNAANSEYHIHKPSST